MEYGDFIDLEYKPKDSDLICLFKITPEKKFTMKEACARVASESSNGTWTDLKVPDRIRKISARCYEIKGNLAKIAYPLELFEKNNMPQIMSSIAGNIFGMKAVKGLRLEDVKWPQDLIKSFPNPQYGIEGIRRIMKIKDRPIIATVPKPKVGFSSEEHANVGFQAWTGGVDLLKDDENLSSQNFNKFEERVKFCMKARDKAEKITGEKKSCLLNITAESKEMVKRAKLLSDYGNEFAMIDILTAGWSSLQTVREACKDLKLAIYAHRAFHAAFDRNPNHGLSMKVLVEISRIIGVDSIHIGGLGKLAGGKEEVYDNWLKSSNENNKSSQYMLEQQWNIKNIFGASSGGLHPGILKRVFDLLGTDIIIQIGGGIHGHPGGTHKGALAVRQSIDAYLENIDIKEYSKNHIELKQALDKWGFKTPE